MYNPENFLNVRLALNLNAVNGIFTISTMSGSGSVSDWVFQNLTKGDQSSYVSLIEIKAVNPSISATKLGKTLSKAFPWIQIKRGRDPRNWSGKLTTRYYGLQWKDKENCEPHGNNGNVNFQFIVDNIPNDFFILTETEKNLCIGHFRKWTVNDNKIVTEVNFYSDWSWSITTLGKVTQPKDLGVENTFQCTRSGIQKVIDVVRSVRYCDGLSEIEPINSTEYYKENVSILHEANSSEYIRFRAKSCKVHLNFGEIRSTCIKCVQANVQVHSNAHSQKDVNNDNETADSESVELSEQDHADMKAVFIAFFPIAPQRCTHFCYRKRPH